MSKGLCNISDLSHYLFTLPKQATSLVITSISRNKLLLTSYLLPLPLSLRTPETSDLGPPNFPSQLPIYSQSKVFFQKIISFFAIFKFVNFANIAKMHTNIRKMIALLAIFLAVKKIY